MPHEPLVSIIVPNYNYSRYLDERMESILNQTYQNYEVIILDDKSTDNSLDVIGKYSNHPKVSKVIINDTNSGSPFIQWRKGIFEASGEIVWIAESDDDCLPTFLERLVKKYVETGSILVFCRSQLINENGDKLRDNHQMNSVFADLCMDGRAFISDYLGLSNEIQNASSAIFCRKTALDIDDSFTSFKGAGDWMFWIKMSLKGKISFVCEELNKYRLHNNTTSSVVKSGVEFREMKSIYCWLLSQGLLTAEQIRSCRKSNLQLILSLKEIPSNVKRKLLKMWDVSPIYIVYLYAVLYYSKIKVFLYQHV